MWIPEIHGQWLVEERHEVRTDELGRSDRALAAEFDLPLISYEGGQHFSGIQPRGQSEPGVEPGYFESENFGVKELQTDGPEEAPKYSALLG